MSMEDEEALLWFYFWTQENPDVDWKTFSIALVRRFGKRNYGVVEEKLIEKDESNTQALGEKRNEVDPNGDINGN
ncbi:neurobeachin-like protein, partial [Trifolium medium]|nr:neurobeachin-like protein [Trifolium medium]